MQRIFLFDAARCFGCNGCAAACANINHTPGGLFWRTVHKLPPYDGDHKTIYLSIACNHCENPPCVKGCPANALEKRDSDGIVLHHADKCLGCRYCQMACPYDAIKWEEASRVVSKCHFCHERLAAGREPACVETCFAGALKQKTVMPEELAYGYKDEYKAEYKKECIGFQYTAGIKPAVRFIHSPAISAETGEETEATNIKRGQ